MCLLLSTFSRFSVTIKTLILIEYLLGLLGHHQAEDFGEE